MSGNLHSFHPRKGWKTLRVYLQKIKSVSCSARKREKMVKREIKKQKIETNKKEKQNRRHGATYNRTIFFQVAASWVSIWIRVWWSKWQNHRNIYSLFFVENLKLHIPTKKQLLALELPLKSTSSTDSRISKIVRALQGIISRDLIPPSIHLSNSLLTDFFPARANFSLLRQAILFITVDVKLSRSTLSKLTIVWWFKNTGDKLIIHDEI